MCTKVETLFLVEVATNLNEPIKIARIVRLSSGQVYLIFQGQIRKLKYPLSSKNIGRQIASILQGFAKKTSQPYMNDFLYRVVQKEENKYYYPNS